MLLYAGRQAVLATKHGKEVAIARPMRAGLGLNVVLPPGLDTDALGTFTGEVERPAPPSEVVIGKARKGMEVTGLSLGIASEGSFGPHPTVPFIACDVEIVAFVDEGLGIELLEDTLTTRTNYAHCEAKHVDDLAAFLTRVRFPSHALVVRPHGRMAPDLLVKGIQDFNTLRTAVRSCADASPDALAHIQTDMRAHLNPTRMSVIRGVAFRLVRRIRSLCPACSLPGWGRVDVERGLPCEACEYPTEMVAQEIRGCVRCEHRLTTPRQDGLGVAPCERCPMCNP